MDIDQTFSKFATKTARITGAPATFLACVALVLVWAVSGPIFKFSETWQLVINTGTTIITFLMVFLIQNTQNRDSAAVQAKLDELILSSAAQDGFIGIEEMSDKELTALHARFAKASDAHSRLVQQLDSEVKHRKGSSSGTKPRAKSKSAGGKTSPARKSSATPRRKAPAKPAS